MKLVVRTGGATVGIVYQDAMLYSIVLYVRSFRGLAYRSVPFVCFFLE